jgi:hypothetical protein
MNEYNIPCADGQTVTVRVNKSDSISLVLRNLKRYHGLDSDDVMAQVFGTFTSPAMTFDTDPAMIHGMLMAFWTGYEMADRNRAN